MEMSVSNIINSFGLGLDIVGVILIWRYGLPQSVSRGGVGHRVITQVNEAVKRKAINYDRLSKAGLGLVVAGFALQLASNFY